MVGTRGSKEPVRVLVVEDDPACRRQLAAALAASDSRPAQIEEAESLAEAVARARAVAIAGAVVSIDLGAAADAVARLRRAGLAGPIFATSRHGSVANAVEAMRAGADDFLVKPYQPTELARRLLARLADHARAAALVAGALASADRAPEDFPHFIGDSPTMRALYEQIRRVAPSKAPVFITGESGTGKEVCAEAIHASSGRAHAPFVAINCSAIPKELMESEIFGHVKGAFTGAHEDRPGAAELTHGGTLFLDEICEMELSLQAKLLRFVQTGAVRRVGDTRLRHVDVRFVCATNRDPVREIEAGRFREDLYYRLYVLPLHLPPLRERAGDVRLLARAFLARFAAEEGRGFRGFTPEAEAALEAHPWPGNVRELQNVIRRVVLLHDDELVSADMLALPPSGSHSESRPAEQTADSLPRVASPPIDPLWQQEQRIIEQALAAFGGNTLKAASALEISPSTIYRKRQAWAQNRAAN